MATRAKLFSQLAKSVDTSGTITSAGISSTVSLGATVYDSVGLLPTSGVNAGDQAFVTSTSRLYINSGVGWYNVAVINSTPVITSITDSDGASGPFALSTEGLDTTITIVASDSDTTDTITYSATADSGFNGLASITQSGDTFTISPFSLDSATTTSGTITFKATDGINIANSIQSFTLDFVSLNWENIEFSLGTASSATGYGTADDQAIFEDKSSNSVTINSFSSTYQVSANPYMEAYSTYFDGSNDYLRVDTALDSFTSTSDVWTIEFWIKPIGSAQNSGSIIPIGINSASTGSNILLYRLNGIGYTTSDTVLSASNSPVQGEWTHVALIHDGTNLKIYHNGSEVGSVAASPQVALADCVIGIGCEFDAANGGSPGNYFKGWISDLRVSDIVRYTTTFTPSISQLLADDANTKGLFCSSNRHIDRSSNGITVNSYSHPKIEAQTPYNVKSQFQSDANKGSVSLHSASNYLVADVSTASGTINPGSSDFTVSLWFYSFSSSTSTTGALFSWGASGIYGPWNIYANQSTQLLNIPMSSTGSSWDISSDTDISGSDFKEEVWNHVEVCRSGSTIYIFLNGEQVAARSITGSLMTPTRDIGIGSRDDGTSNFVGYVSDVQYILGTALHTSNFTPPTSPVNSNNSALRLVFDNMGYYDTQAVWRTNETNGSVTVSDAQTKFANTSLLLASDGYISTNYNGAYQIGSAAFTIEGWFRMPSTINGTAHNLWGFNSAPGGPGAKLVAWCTPTSLVFHPGNLGSDAQGSATFTANTWYHLAFTRESDGTLKCWQNGNLIGTGSCTNNFSGITANLVIGYVGEAYGAKFNGYIENFQVFSGVAKYTTNFTPPTQTQGRTYQAES